jgi:hypothetical protein
MAKIIEVPGQGPVGFPDSMTDDQIVAAIKRMPKAEGQAPAQSPAPAPAPQADPRLDRIRAFTDETDKLLGLTPGTSLAQLRVESGLRDNAVSPVGAKGLAQVMDPTRAALEKRLGRTLDPFNTDHALLMQREVLRENMQKFGNREDALRAYNAGWNRNRWNNPETAAYVDKINGNMGGTPAEGAASSERVAYRSFSPVRQDINPKSLNTDADWIRASLMMYNFWERKPFEGTDDEIAEWGKDSFGQFNYNLVSMAEIAAALRNASQEEKEAFLWMMDTYDNTNISFEGTGRAFKGILTDPTNLIGVGTLGVGFIGTQAAKQATKLGVRKMIIESMARTGIAAGLQTGVFSAADSTIRQGIEVDAGRREEIDLAKVGVDTAIGATAGVILGTAADAAATKIISAVRNARRGVDTPSTPGVVPDAAAKAADDVNVSGVVPEGAAKAADEVIPGVPARDPNLGTTLTPDEIAEATARQQQGRLPADDVIPNVSPDAPRVNVPEMNTGLRSTPMSMEQLTKLGDEVAVQLRPLSDKDLVGALEGVRNASLPFEEMRIVARGVQMYADELRIEKAELLKKVNAKPDAPEVPAMLERLDAIEARLGPLSMADDAFGSMAGSILRQRQEGLPGVQGITVESIMKEQGLSKADAEKVWADAVGQASVTAEARKIAQQFDDVAAKALDDGDLEGAAIAAVQKHKELDARVEAYVPRSATLVDKLTELAISNVFSLKTLMINIIPSGIKTLVIPGLKAIFNNPFQKATRVELAASYSAMRSSFGGALRSASAAYKYEQALLTRDGIRLVEGELAMTGKLGGALRIFPRLLNASDEFLAKLNYDSFIAGKAGAEAAIEGAEQGLKGKELNKFIDDAIKKAMDDSMKPTSGDELVVPIMNKGLNLGLTGDDLFKFVEREAVKNPEALRKGNSEEALNYARDVLYKRKFSGNNSFSSAAQTYEETMKKFPTVKLVIGQLFFRTPIRVFEEGIRLTPGLQFIAPGFMQDLAGNNGNLKRVRAQAEAMASLSIAAGVLSLYGQGKITGDGAYSDYRQQKTRVDGPQAEPYTIKLSDGSTWSYRGFDPLATPVKIMVNALERMDKLRIREAQGEFVDKAAYKQAIAAITVGTMSIAQALRDASLVEGADNFLKFVETTFNPEKGEADFIKFVGDKLFLLVPNTLHKIARENDPEIRDPRTFWQMTEQKLLRPLGLDSDVEKSAFAYDVLGNVRRTGDTGALWNVFSTATVEERAKGMSETQQFVMTEMDRLQRTTGVTFAPPIKHRDFGDTDMRTIMAADGKRTMYDVWQQNYKALNPENILAPILAAPLPEGTFKYRAAKVEEVQQTISSLQDAAFAQTMVQERDVIERYINETLKRAKSQSGLFDTPRPY